jgi:hypothetical protein
MERIRAGFKDYFQALGIELPEPIPAQGQLQQNGWFIRYVLTQDEQLESCLDFYADHPQTNPRHVRILHTGEVIALESFWDSFSFDPEIEGAKEAAWQEFREHNERVSAELRRKGLM